MFDAFGGDRWWPLNSQLAVVRAAPQRVCDALNPTGRGVVAHYDSLSDAVAARAPYPFGRQDTEFLIRTTDGSTVALSSAAPSADSLHRYLWPAENSLHCECIAAEWVPRHRTRLAGAGFDHFISRASRASAPGPRNTDQLSVQVTDQGRQWVFTRVGPGAGYQQRGYEEPDAYRARVVSDRLPLDLIHRYLLGAGVPVDDPGYLTGPVTTMSLPARIPSDITWSTMTQLRAAAGYPPEYTQPELRAVPRLPDNQVRR